ncbi:endonuclease MutS2 [bacterium]|nr:endonuclease MutS2 [bacterium]
MNERTLKVLEFDKIVEYLEGYTITEYGKLKNSNIMPSSDKDVVIKLLDETSEAILLMESISGNYLRGIKDLRTPLDRSKILGIHLKPLELIEVAVLAKISREFKDAFHKVEGEFLRLETYIQRLTSCRNVEDSIFPCFDSDGKILDSASKKLGTIRKKIARLESTVRKRLEEIISRKEMDLVIQERYVTIRNSRFVIPVKSSYKYKVPGIVVDRSSTGQTLFIQPMGIVELDNEITQMRLEEEEEQIRILKELTRIVGDNHDYLQENLETLSNLDLIFARGKLSKKWNGKRPLHSDSFHLSLKEGYHPILLDIKDRGKIEKVIPFDIELVDEKVLVITGPNTGGKTAALKTVGLLCLLNQSGIFTPVNEDSQFPIFKAVYADIGDEQSFEQSLSTFSSHMKNIINIINEADDGTLILLDEIGAGTDPDEGSTLSVAILEELIKQNVKVIVTTHHRLLKSLAHSRTEFKNAAMEFDDNTLMPTYHIRMGMPGRSNALEVSKHLGLQESIISRARTLTGSEAVHLDDLIKRLEEESKSVEKLKMELTEQKRINEERRKRLEDKESYIKYDSFLEAEGALLKAKSILSQAEGAIHKKNMTLAEIKILKKEVEQETKQVKKIQEKRFEKNLLKLKEIRKGDNIFIKSLKKTGKVISVDQKTNRMKVQAGSLLVDLDFKNEKLYSAPIRKVEEKAAQTISIDSPGGKADSFVHELNIIGQHTDECVEQIMKFIDDAVMVNMDKIRIIHGVGSGRLKNSVHDLLKSHPNVASYSLDTDNPGGDGVTIVTIK